ncbi:MAG: hypothetical protein CO128_02405 [Ignavibacteriales bacterium CG_4_9_14_3_um_filter_30_11]|nr:MAG: hypothetical protein CO128_02405 [Ignavibacteriales bacterium CG_4_9_14_3_um_filter_30_11]
MKKVYTKMTFIIVAALLMFLQITITAQTTASISGSINDQSGDPLVGATIIAVHVPTGTQYGTTTRLDGKFNINAVRVGGPYEIAISYVGYQKKTHTIDNLVLSQDYQLDVKMVESAIELSGITVTADKNAIISSARTGSTQNVSTKQIEDIPTISRSFQNFAKLSPLFSGLNSSAAGRSNRFNNIQIDGTQYNDLFGLGSSGTPGGQAGTNPISLDAIQEFQVIIAPFDVRLSGFTGGGINAITRSGTNKIQGSVFGLGRNQNLVGDKLVGVDSPVDEFKEWQYGFRLGGPLKEDKVFFFVNGEITGRNTPTTNQSLSTTGVEAGAILMKSILGSRGLSVGDYGAFTTKRPTDKLFARLDFNLSDNHKLNLHYNFVNATSDILGSRTSSSSFSFDSYLYQFEDITNNVVAQLNSTFGNNMANELIVGYTTIRDKRGPETTLLPEIEVRDVVTYRAGTDRFSSANALDQDIFEISDNFTIYTGDHTFTLGTHNEFFSFTNLFLRSFGGFYQYNSLADLQAGKVAFYQRVFPLIGNGAAEFSVRQYGFYAQDEFQVSSNFRLTYGLRVDIPTYPDDPLNNDSVSTYFPGVSTASAPSGNILWAPRAGFNLDIDGKKTTQIRGGVGIFSGRPAYVWISNQYGNTGNTLAEVRGNGTSLQFSPDAKKQPGPGDPGTFSAAKTAEIDLSDPDLKMPQVLRYNIGIDHQLPLGFIGTVEFLYTKAVNDFVYEKLNIKNHDNPAVFTANGPNDTRPLYGGTDRKNNNFFDVLRLKNTDEGYSYNLTFQVQRNAIRGFSVNAGYTLGRAKDLNSVNSSQARSQMRFNPIAGDPNNPVLSRSQYEIRNRVFASVTYTGEFFKNASTIISVFFNGENGAPFSYIYRNDINNDGFDSNDLFYIPRDDSDILLGTVSGGVFTPDAQMYADFNSFIANDEYLSANRGKIAERNGATNPWVSYVDLHIAQEVPIVTGHKLVLSLDIENLMNLINSDWGENNSVFSTFRIVDRRGTTSSGINVYKFTAPANNTPFTASNFSSRWQMQLGVRYTF